VRAVLVCRAGVPVREAARCTAADAGHRPQEASEGHAVAGPLCGVKLKVAAQGASSQAVQIRTRRGGSLPIYCFNHS